MKNFILNFIPKPWILSLELLLLASVCMDAQIRDTQQFPMEQFMGVNIHREDPIERLKCVGFVREYHDWAVDEGNFYQTSSLSSRPYPANRYSWNLQQSTSTKFDDFYRQTQLILDPTGLTRSPICATMKQCLPYLAGGDTYGTYSELKPVNYYQSGRAKPAIGFPDANTPLGYVPIKAWKDPTAYYWMADWLYQFSRRYGSDTRILPPYATKLDLFWQGASETDRKGLNTVGYVELWNEPNKYWIRNYENHLDSSWLKATQFTGAEYAAMASTAYDGHENRVKVTPINFLYDYVPGVHSADPQMKFVMGGSAGKGKKFTAEIKVEDDPTFSSDSVFGGHSYWYKDATYHRVLRFAKPNGDATRPDEVVYVSWLPTKTNAEKFNVKIYLNPEDIATTQATIIQMSVGDINGVRKAIPAANMGTEGTRRYVIVPYLSEMPLFIRLGESITDNNPPMPDIQSSANSRGISCDALQVEVRTPLPLGGFYRVYYYERPNSELLGIPPFNLNDPYIKFYKDSVTTSQIVIANLKLAHNYYPIYVQTVDSNGNVSAVATTLLATTPFFEGSIPKRVMSSSRPEVLNQLFDYGNIDFCYPLRRKGNGNTYNYLDEWRTDSLDAAVIEFNEPYFIDAATLLDGTGAGDFQIAYWDGNTYKDWIKYTTDDYDAWKSFQGIPIPTTRLRVTKSSNGRIRKVILKGRKSSNPTYAHSPVCGVDVPSIYNITAINDTISTLSRAIQVNRLPNNSFTGVLRIDSSVFIVDKDYVLSGVVYLNSNNASIVVQSGKTLRLDTANLRGCFGMWKGIVVEPGATLILNESQVRDAKIGLHLINYTKPHSLSGKTVLKLSRSVFEENQTGILSQSYYPQNVVDSARSYIVGCSFDGNFRDLHLENVNTTLPNRALVGIRLENGQLNIGAKDSLSNLFRDLANGIEADTLTLTIANSFFNHIRPKATLQTATLPFSPISYGGHAVYAERSKVWLYGRRDTDMFQKVYRGLYGYRTDFNVSHVKLQAEQNVIQSDFSSGASTFTGNSLKSFYGSALHYWQAGGYFTSSGNNMDCGEVNAPIDAVPIGSFYHLSVANDSIRMTRDTIRGANPPAGYSGSFGLIALNAIKKARIRQNQLIFNNYQNNTAPNVIGIRLELVENSMILRNYIKGIPNGDSVMANSPSQVGILSNNSQNNAFYCNEVVNARVGMQFQLNNLATTIPQGNIAGNVLSGYNIGLKVDDLGMIGPQTHRRNEWKPIQTANNYYQDAVLENPDANMRRRLDNVVKVQQENLIAPVKISTSDWFFIETANVGVPFECGRDAPNSIGNSGNGNAGAYVSIADNSYQIYTQDPEAYIWMLEKQAYEVFADLPLIAQTVIMQTYLNQKQGTELETFYQLKKGFESLFTKDAIRAARLKELNAFMDTWAAKKYAANNGLIAEDADFFAKNKEYQDLNELEKQSTLTKAQALLQLNATLPDEIAGFLSKNTGKFQRPYVFYEKVINHLYLTKIMEGTVVYTSKEQAIVKKIAMMCPLIAGEAPLKARTLYKHFIDPVSLPEPNCEQVPKTIPKQRTAPSFKAYPNPTTGFLNLVSETGTGRFAWELCNATGMVLKTGQTNRFVESIDVSDLPNGMYLIRVLEQGNQSTVLKIVVLK